MARQPPDSDFRPDSQGITLPSFSSFLSSAGQSELSSASDPPPEQATTERLQQTHRTLPSIGQREFFNERRYVQNRAPPPPSPGIRPPSSEYRPTSGQSHSQQLPAINSRPYTHTPPEVSHGVHNHPARRSFHEHGVSPSDQLQDSSHSKVLIGEQVVEGKLCYVYSDHTHCPKSINGDVVNPKWGTTKAGKPRKRLGQACNTCREKKIRCDPQVPKCAQCQKFGRECRFEQR
jgi:hypothetical protein